MQEFTCLSVSLFSGVCRRAGEGGARVCVCIRVQTGGLTCIPIFCSLPAAPALCPRTDQPHLLPHPHSPHVVSFPSLAHGPHSFLHFVPHPSLITQIRSSSNHHAELQSGPLTHSGSPHPFELLLPSAQWPIRHESHKYCRGGVMLGMPSGFYHFL